MRHRHITCGVQRICVVAPDADAIEAHEEGDEIVLVCTLCLETHRVPIELEAIVNARHTCDDRTSSL